MRLPTLRGTVVALSIVVIGGGAAGATLLREGDDASVGPISDADVADLSNVDTSSDITAEFVPVGDREGGFAGYVRTADVFMPGQPRNPGRYVPVYDKNGGRVGLLVSGYGFVPNEVADRPDFDPDELRAEAARELGAP